MPLHVYRKAPPADSLPPTPPPRRFHLLPLLASALGLLLIGFVLWPIISYELASSRAARPTTVSGLLTPVVDSSSSGPRVLNSTDYTKASNWFPRYPASAVSPATAVSSGTYTLSIPKLKIDSATVIIGGEDLAQSLIHYPQTALPGQYGSPVVFGHSILPQFYNPKSYLAIFSLLPSLESGDQIFLTHDNVTYTYQVTTKQEVYPEDYWVLEQNYDQQRLKLITCVPPGLKTRRLVVTAQLQRS